LQDATGTGILSRERRTGRLLIVFNCAFFNRAIMADCEWNKFDMDIETGVTLMAGQTFKLVCEQCGSLTVALPIEAQPDPCSILKCGRCGSPRGTLQSLRDTSIQPDIRHPV
jgi:hypothetical protein